MTQPVKQAADGLLEQELALSAYLEALLVPADAPAPQPAPQSAGAAVVSLPQSRAAPEETAEPRGETPDWAREPFQCLLFKVAGLNLAAPLVMLNGILEWAPRNVTPMPNRSPWFLGLLPYRGVNVKVIDTLQVVMPERPRREPADPAQQRVVLMDERRWGLLCDGITSVVTLTSENVRWRTAGTRRRWLAGTAVDHMCALLDVEQFVALLGSDRLGRRDA
jgi:purine-binding chemotaxis protein CheW